MASILQCYAAKVFTNQQGEFDMFAYRHGVVGLAVAVALGFAAPCGAVDLISHNGFAECWTSAITKDMFYSAAEASIEGLTGCVSPQSGGGASVCNTVAGCAGGVAGCKVTLHIGNATGDFGSGSFSAPGSADQILVPITGIDNCTMQLNNIVLSYAWSNTLQADGNNGKYASALPSRSVTISSYTTGGNCQPTTVALLATTAKNSAQTAAGNAIAPLLTAATVGESVCPLTP